MSGKMKAMIAAGVTAFVIFFLGTTYFYGPILTSTTPPAAMNPFVALLITTVVLVIFFSWVYDHVGDGPKAGLVVALSQVILVDVYYPMQGLRSWAAAGASAVLLLVGWWVVGTVYAKVLGGGEAA